MREWMLTFVSVTRGLKRFRPHRVRVTYGHGLARSRWLNNRAPAQAGAQDY